MKFEVKPGRELIHSEGGSIRHIWVSIEAPTTPAQTARMPVNLALVIDRSGSMEHGKLERAKDAVLCALRSLGPEDRFSIVAYDDRIDLLMESCVATPANRARAEVSLGALTPRGATNLFDGCMRGCEQVAKHLRDTDVGRCLLLTDGLANRGLMDHDEIVQHVAELRARRVATTTFGVGADFDETLLQRMAEVGGGNSYFIESASQIPDFVASEVGEALEVVAPDAALVVKAPSGVEIVPLNGYPVLAEGNTWRFELGSLISGQVLNPILAVRSPAGEEGAGLEIALSLADRNGTLETPEQCVRFTFAGRAQCDAQPRERAVDHRVAELQAARAAREALQHNKALDYQSAREVLGTCAKDIRGYAGDDERLLRTAQEVMDRVDEYSTKLDPIARKRHVARARDVLMEKKLGRSVRSDAQRSVVLMPTHPAVYGSTARAVSALQDRGPNPFFDLDSDGVLMKPTKGDGVDVLEPDHEARLVALARHYRPEPSICIVITPQGHHDHWFSHWLKGERTAVISLNGWSGLASVAPEAFVAYEAILYGLCALFPHGYYHPLELAHEETRGCLFDLCRMKADIEIKLQTMDICDTCRDGLAARLIPLEPLRELCDVVRSLARPVPA